MKKAVSTDIFILLAFAAIYIIWGTTYLAVRIGIQTIPPFMMGAMRYLVAATAFLVFCLFKKEVIFTKAVYKNLLLGAVMQTGGQAIIFWAEQYISSGFAAILVATEPIWFILLDKPQWRYYFHNKFIIGGVAAGFAGILLLFKNLLSVHASQAGSGLELVASLATIAACLIWTGGSLYFKHHRPAGSVYSSLGWQLAGGAISCLLVCSMRHEWHAVTWSAITFHSWMAVLYLAVAGSIIAFAAYNWLLTKKPAAVVGTYAYINPVIAVIIGSMLMRESITANQIMGMIVILFSAVLINKGNGKVGEK